MSDEALAFMVSLAAASAFEAWRSGSVGMLYVLSTIIYTPNHCYLANASCHILSQNLALSTLTQPDH
jgi:hypothetical protein